MSPTMVSYAQNREDVLLERLFKGQAVGTWIDVGAWDPVVDSVTKHLSLRGWRGVNVEPHPELHARLVADRPGDTNLRVALGPTPGRARFVLRPQSGLSSLRRSSEPLEASEREVEVEVETLASICERHVRGPIDLLKVDVEGGERGVLEGGDWSRFRPRVLVIEAARPGAPDSAWREWEPFLLERGYCFAYFDGLNRYYLERSDADLARHFAVPVNVLDDFEPHAMRRLHEAAREAQASERGMRESLSWRLTAPLRAAGRWVAGQRNAPR